MNICGHNVRYERYCWRQEVVCLVVAQGLKKSAHGAKVATEEARDVERGHKYSHKEGKLDPGNQACRTAVNQTAQPRKEISTSSCQYVRIPHHHPRQVSKEGAGRRDDGKR